MPVVSNFTKRTFKISDDTYIEFEELLGSGSCGSVYKVKKITIHDKVVSSIKTLSAKVISTKQLKLSSNRKSSLAKLKHEVLILSNISHTGIVNLHGVVDMTDFLILLLDFVPNGELFCRIEKGPLQEEQARYIFVQIAKTLMYIHSCNIMHRDLKLENILIESEVAPNFLKVKIADFGLSKALYDFKGVARSRVGTPQYWAPEVCDSSKNLSAYSYSADIWSLGCLLYVLVTGTYPFEVNSDTDNFADDCLLELPLDKLKNLSSECIWIIKQLVQVNPSNRMSLTTLSKTSWFTKPFSVELPELKILEKAPINVNLGPSLFGVSSEPVEVDTLPILTDLSIVPNFSLINNNLVTNAAVNTAGMLKMLNNVNDKLDKVLYLNQDVFMNYNGINQVNDAFGLFISSNNQLFIKQNDKILPISFIVSNNRITNTNQQFTGDYLTSGSAQSSPQLAEPMKSDTQLLSYSFNRSPNLPESHYNFKNVPGAFLDTSILLDNILKILFIIQQLAICFFGNVTITERFNDLQLRFSDLLLSLKSAINNIITITQNLASLIKDLLAVLDCKAESVYEILFNQLHSGLMQIISTINSVKMLYSTLIHYPKDILIKVMNTKCYASLNIGSIPILNAYVHEIETINNTFQYNVVSCHAQGFTDSTNLYVSSGTNGKRKVTDNIDCMNGIDNFIDLLRTSSFVNGEDEDNINNEGFQSVSLKNQKKSARYMSHSGKTLDKFNTVLFSDDSCSVSTISIDNIHNTSNNSYTNNQQHQDANNSYLTSVRPSNSFSDSNSCANDMLSSDSPTLLSQSVDPCSLSSQRVASYSSNSYSSNETDQNSQENTHNNSQISLDDSKFIVNTEEQQKSKLYQNILTNIDNLIRLISLSLEICDSSETRFKSYVGSMVNCKSLVLVNSISELFLSNTKTKLNDLLLFCVENERQCSNFLTNYIKFEAIYRKYNSVYYSFFSQLVTFSI